MMDDAQANKRPDAEKVFLEYVDRRIAGNELDFDEWCTRHPGVTEELHQLRARWEDLDGLLDLAVRPPPTEPTPLSQILHQCGSVSSAASPPPPDGGNKTLRDTLMERLSARIGAFGRYELKGEIARGGQGVIYKAWDTDLHRFVAMKLILSTPRSPSSGSSVGTTALARFVEEAQATAQLDHPSIVTIHEVGVDDDGHIYYTMPLIRGHDLRTVFQWVRKARDGWSVPRVVDVLLRVCDAMAFAHSRGAVHRDLKPANIMVGGFGEVNVMDWGMVHLSEDAPTPGSGLPRAIAAGTPPYMAPEQARGDREGLEPLVDVYAVGAMLYQLLTRRVPYAEAKASNSPQAIARRVIAGPPSRIDDVCRDQPHPAELVAICEKAMARDPNARYANMQQLAADFRAFLEHRVVNAYEVGAIAELRKWMRRNRLLAGVLVLSVVSLASAFILTMDAYEAEKDANIEKEAALDVAQAALKNEEAARRKAQRALEEEQAAKLQAQASFEKEQVAKLKAERLFEEERWQRYVRDVTASYAALLRGDVDAVRTWIEDAPSELRGWEWDHLVSRCELGERILWDGDGAISALAIAPRGDRFVAGDVAGDVVAGRLDGSEAPRSWASLKREIQCLAFSPNARSVAAGLDGGWIALFQDGEYVSRFEMPDAGHCLDVAFTGNGNGLVVGLQNDTFAAQWFGVARIDLGTDTVALAWNRAGRARAMDVRDADRIAVGHEDGRIVIHDASGEEAEIAWNPDGEDERVVRQRVVASSSHGRVVFLTPSAEVTIVDDGRVSTSVGRGPFSDVHATDRAGPVAAIDEYGDIHCWPTSNVASIPVRWRPSGASLTSLRRVAMAADGRTIVVGDRQGRVRAFHAGYGRAAHSRSASGSALCLVASADGRWLAVGGRDGSITLWDTVSMDVAGRLEGHADRVRDMAFHEDGSLLASAAMDGTVRVWDTDSLSLAPLLLADETVSSFGAIAFTPDGKRVVAGARRGGRIITWDIESGTCVEQRHGDDAHSSYVNAITHLSDGRVVSCSRDGTILVWNGHRARRLLDGDAVVVDITVASDGTKLAACAVDGLRMWDTEDLTLLWHKPSVTEVRSLAFTPDGRRLVTGDEGGFVRLRDAGTAEVVLTLAGLDQKIVDIAMCRSGRVSAVVERNEMVTISTWERAR